MTEVTHRNDRVRVESIARAIYGAEYDVNEYPWEDEPGKESYRQMAQAAVAALSTPPAEPGALLEAFDKFSKATSMEGGPSLAMQRHDPTWQAWKALCDAFAATPPAQAEEDELMHLFETAYQESMKFHGGTEPYIARLHALRAIRTRLRNG
ncbi:MAG: hypothetical protein Q8M26_08580 [Pseudolabrys sp.]|nr:hypothetical protein [Pseudolabrys sp.]